MLAWINAIPSLVALNWWHPADVDAESGTAGKCSKTQVPRDKMDSTGGQRSSRQETPPRSRRTVPGPLRAPARMLTDFRALGHQSARTCDMCCSCTCSCCRRCAGRTADASVIAAPFTAPSCPAGHAWFTITSADARAQGEAVRCWHGVRSNNEHLSYRPRFGAFKRSDHGRLPYLSS